MALYARKEGDSMDVTAKQYWSSVVDSLACIYWYRNSSNERGAGFFRFEDFPRKVELSRSYYNRHYPKPTTAFGLQTRSEIDAFFVQMLEHPERLADCDRTATENYKTAAPPIPLRLL